MSTHRFVVVVEVNDEKLDKDGRLDKPDTWDHMDLTEAIVTYTAVPVEVDDHEEFES